MGHPQLLGKPIPVPHHNHSKQLFLIFSLNEPSFILKLLSLVTTDPSKKSVSVPGMQVMVWADSVIFWGGNRTKLFKAQEHEG